MDINVLPQNTETFISFEFGDCVVKDSLQFLPDSLDKLAQTLADDPNITDLLKEAPIGFKNKV